MQVAVRGSKFEVSADLPSSVAPLVMRASGKARGLHFRPWIVTGAACQHPAFVLWYKQRPERAGPPRKPGRPSPTTRSSFRCSPD